MQASFYVRNIKFDIDFMLVVDSHLDIVMGDYLLVQSNPNQNFRVSVNASFEIYESDFFTTYSIVSCRKIRHSHLEEPVVFTTTEPEIYFTKP